MTEDKVGASTASNQLYGVDCDEFENMKKRLTNIENNRWLEEYERYPKSFQKLKAQILKEDKNKCCRCSLSCTTKLYIMDGGKPICTRCLDMLKKMLLKETPLSELSDNKLIDYAYALRFYAYRKGNDNQTQNRYLGYYQGIQEELNRRKQLSKESKVKK